MLFSAGCCNCKCQRTCVSRCIGGLCYTYQYFFYYRYAQFTHSADKRLLYLYRHWELMGVGLITDLTLLAGQVQVQRWTRGYGQSIRSIAKGGDVWESNKPSTNWETNDLTASKNIIGRMILLAVSRIVALLCFIQAIGAIFFVDCTCKKARGKVEKHKRLDKLFLARRKLKCRDSKNQNSTK